MENPIPATVIQSLRRAHERQRLPHAFIFCGEEGPEREDCALLLARGALCPAQQAVFGCGECGSCRRVMSRTHPDLIWVLSDEAAMERGLTQKNTKVTKGSQRNIVVEAVREGVKRFQLAAYEGVGRVMIFVDAHTMNQHAQNALLKPLEEPPENTLLILLAPNPRAMINTIASRCQSVFFPPNAASSEHEEAPQVAEWLDLLEANDSRTTMAAIESLGKDRSVVHEHLKALRSTLMQSALEDAKESVEHARQRVEWIEKIGTALHSINRNQNVTLTLEKTFLGSR